MNDGGMILGTIFAIILGFIAIFIILLLVFYVYSALVLMAIAKKTRTPDGWMAWVPILNVYLMTRIGKVNPWTMIGLLIVMIPFLNYVSGLVVLVLTIYWWWKIAEACKKPGWWGLLMAVPVVNLILMGVLAWRK